MRRLAIGIVLDLVLLAVAFVACTPLFAKEHPTENENIARTLLGLAIVVLFVVLIGLLAAAVRRFAGRIARSS